MRTEQILQAVKEELEQRQSTTGVRSIHITVWYKQAQPVRVETDVKTEREL